MLMRSSYFGLVIALMLVPGFMLAAKRDSTTSPAPGPAPKSATGDDSLRQYRHTRVGTTPRMSRTPGPLITPGSPIERRTTIAPFPIPGDTSDAAIQCSKTLNLPRDGVTALEPLPGAVPGAFSNGPLKLSEPEPVYPRAARDAGIQGTIVVMAYVLADGTVGQTRIVNSIPALDAAAVQAVKRMRFRPAYYRDRSAPDWVGIPVTFRLH